MFKATSFKSPTVNNNKEKKFQEIRDMQFSAYLNKNLSSKIVDLILQIRLP